MKKIIIFFLLFTAFYCFVDNNLIYCETIFLSQYDEKTNSLLFFDGVRLMLDEKQIYSVFLDNVELCTIEFFEISNNWSKAKIIEKKRDIPAPKNVEIFKKGEKKDIFIPPPPKKEEKKTEIDEKDRIVLDFVFPEKVLLFYKGTEAGIEKGSRYAIIVDGEEKGIIETLEVTKHWTKAKIESGYENLKNLEGKEAKIKFLEKEIVKEEIKEEKKIEKKEEKIKIEEEKKAPEKVKKPSPPAERLPTYFSDLTPQHGFLKIQTYSGNDYVGRITSFQGAFGIQHKNLGFGFSSLHGSGLSSYALFGILKINNKNGIGKINGNTNVSLLAGGFKWELDNYYDPDLASYRTISLSGPFFGISGNITSNVLNIYGLTYLMKYDNDSTSRYEVGLDYLFTKNLALDISLKGFYEGENEEFHYGLKFRF